MSWLKIFGSSEKQEVLCPYCDKPAAGHDVEACADRGMNRRSFFFMGIMGASAAALAARFDGIPLPSAKVQVIARWRDLIQVKNPQGDFVIAYENARRISDVGMLRHERWVEGNSREATLANPGGLWHEPAAHLSFSAHDAARNPRVSSAIQEMQILAVTDKATGKPLEYRIVRAAAFDAHLDKQRKIQEAETAERNQLNRVRDWWGPYATLAKGPLDKAGYTRVMDPRENVFIDVPDRTAKIAKLLEKHPKHPLLTNLWARAKFGGDGSGPAPSWLPA